MVLSALVCGEEEGGGGLCTDWPERGKELQGSIGTKAKRRGASQSSQRAQQRQNAHVDLSDDTALSLSLSVSV